MRKSLGEFPSGSVNSILVSVDVVIAGKLRHSPVGHMRISNFVLLIITLAGAVLQSHAQNSQPQPQESVADTTSEGRQIFATSCAACHGLDGSGTQRAPNIAASDRLQRLSSADILRIVSQGVPGTGMPGFGSLGEARLKAVVAYVRDLQGKTTAASVPGDPKHGRQLFFGSAGCSSCHALGGTGGFIGPDLTAYAQTRSAERTKAAIIDRTARDSRFDVATVISADGQKHRGIVRNEDNFSLQLQSLDGSFHFFSKAGLKHIEREPSSLMPSDYGVKLTPGELDDLVSFLHDAGSSAKAPQKKEKEDDEQ
jgi:cytochrome c oxidase cbb3-type subunit III